MGLLDKWSHGYGATDISSFTRLSSLAATAIARELVSEGRRQVDDVSVDVLRGTLPDGRIERLYFSRQSHLPLRVDMWEEGPEAERTPGESYLARFFLSDYKATDGIMVPYTIRRERPNSVAIYKWKTVRHNADIDAAVFSEVK